MTRRPSKGLTFFLSFASGVGHLYLGAMTRGLQFMLLFAGAIALSNYLAVDFLPYLLPVIWFYALFDAMQLASQEVIQDKPLLPWNNLKGATTGWILICFGFLLAAGELLPPVVSTVLAEYDWSWTGVRTVIIALVLVIVGIFLLKGKKVKANG